MTTGYKSDPYIRSSTPFYKVKWSKLNKPDLFPLWKKLTQFALAILKKVERRKKDKKVEK